MENMTEMMSQSSIITMEIDGVTVKDLAFITGSQLE